MNKIIFTAIVLFCSLFTTPAYSQEYLPSENTYQNMFPEESSSRNRQLHKGFGSDEDVDNEPGNAPIGEGLLVLSVLGAAYGWSKKGKKSKE